MTMLLAYVFTILFYPHLRAWLLILERREDREREKNIGVMISSCTRPDWDLTHNPGV